MAGFVRKDQPTETKQVEVTISDHVLAIALATGKTVEEAAVVAGVSERTAYRRKDNPAFQSYLNAIRRSHNERFSDKARSRLDEVLDRLFEFICYEDGTAIRALELIIKVAKDVPPLLETELPPSIAHDSTTESEQEASSSKDQESETVSEPESPTSNAKESKPESKQDLPVKLNGKSSSAATKKTAPKQRLVRR